MAQVHYKGEFRSAKHHFLLLWHHYLKYFNDMPLLQVRWIQLQIWWAPEEPQKDWVCCFLLDSHIDVENNGILCKRALVWLDPSKRGRPGPINVSSDWNFLILLRSLFCNRRGPSRDRYRLSIHKNILVWVHQGIQQDSECSQDPKSIRFSYQLRKKEQLW